MILRYRTNFIGVIVLTKAWLQCRVECVGGSFSKIHYSTCGEVDTLRHGMSLPYSLINDNNVLQCEKKRSRYSLIVSGALNRCKIR